MIDIEHPLWQKILTKDDFNNLDHGIFIVNDVMDKFVNFLDDQILNNKPSKLMLLEIQSMFYNWDCSSHLFDSLLTNERISFEDYFLLLQTSPLPKRYSYQMLLKHGQIQIFKLWMTASMKLNLRQNEDFKSWFIQNILKLNHETILFMIQSEFIILRFEICQVFPPLPYSILLKIQESIWSEYYDRLTKPLTMIEYKIPKKPGVYVLDYEVIGWKILKTKLEGSIDSEFFEGQPVIAKLKISPNSIIVRPKKGNKLRCSNYSIEWMKTKSNRFIDQAFSPIKLSTYKINKIYSCWNINVDLYHTCTTGLHFFESFDDAIESNYNMISF